MPSMEPLPETVEAVDELDPGTDDGELLPALLGLVTRAEDDVPGLAAVSLTRLKEDLTFTLVASADEERPDARVPHPEARPRAGWVSGGREPAPGDALDEAQWRARGEESEPNGIRSTLTLPILSEGEVVETVTLYATSEAAFDGHHERLAAIFGAWADGAVTNADLSFSSQEDARQAPRRVRDRIMVDVAIGVLAAQLGIGVDRAEQRLEEAAARVGLSPVELARRIVRPGETP